MVERIPSILDRLDRLEKDMVDMRALLMSSVDDIKNTIKGEISELKTEQIRDLKDRMADGLRRLEGTQADFLKYKEEQAQEFRKLERAQDRWQTSAGVVNWLIKFAFAVIGAGATIVGYETLGHH